jgi:hypothetical protein
MDDMKSKAINEAGILAALQERVKELDCLLPDWRYSTTA